MMKLVAAALGAVVIAAPALADVKAGVEAWGRGDFARAVQEWRGPAAAGDADAQFNLGQAYKLGRGVPTDQGIAIEWFRKAALQGHPKAEDNYGLALFQEGRKNEAVQWLERSVARDEKRAELVLGTMLFNADGLPRDWTRAYALVTRSSQQGLPQGSQTLAQMDHYIAEDQRRDGIAMAQQIEARGRAMKVASTPMATEAVAPSTVAQPAPKVATATAAPKAAPTPAAPKVTPPTAPKPVTRTAAAEKAPAAKPAATAKAEAKPAAKPVTAAAPGKWRVQLGAFHDDSNARSLWNSVGGRVGGTASFARTAGITRLQAGGFPSRQAAQQACTKARVACTVVAP
jgi:cell division septation protein DedD